MAVRALLAKAKSCSFDVSGPCYGPPASAVPVGISGCCSRVRVSRGSGSKRVAPLPTAICFDIQVSSPHTWFPLVG